MNATYKSTPHPEVSEPGTQQRWQVGPYAVYGDDWPAPWVDYADRNFHRIELQGGMHALRVELGEVAVGASGPQTALGGTLEIRRTDDGCFEVETPDILHAKLDLTHLRLRIDLLGFATAPELNYGNALRAAVSVALPLHFDGLMFHASSGILDGKGVFFPGISTAGKTTLALGFKKVTYISDDISLTRDLLRAPRLSASPFFGIAGRRGANEDAPLAAVGVLVRKNPEKTTLVRLSTKDALKELMRHAVCWSHDAMVQAAIFTRVHNLIEQVPVFAVERFIGDSSDEVMEQVLEAAAKSN